MDFEIQQNWNQLNKYDSLEKVETNIRRLEIILLIALTIIILTKGYRTAILTIIITILALYIFRKSITNYLRRRWKVQTDE